jgi:two-component system sensor histidine kinase HydH
MEVKARMAVAEGSAERHARRRLSPVAGPPIAAMFDVLLSESESGIVLLDPDRRVAQINAAAAALLGTTPARARGAAAAELLRAVIPGDDPVGEGYRLRTTDREAMLVSQKGGEVPVWLKTHRIGSPPWLLVTLRDLTQLRRMHEELRRNERLALLGQLATGVAHEIRNPLAGIGTSAQVLLRRFEPRDERARFVQVILDEVSRLDRIVTSLLQYSRPRSPVLQRVELPALVRHVRELLADQLVAAGVQAELEFAPRLPPIYVDSDLVTQVLLNVSLNAVQAMPKGGMLRIEVRRVRRRQPPRGPGRRTSDAPGRAAAPPWAEFVQVRVSDTGIGMARGVLRKLFHPFFTTRPDGTGLGLSICQTIMHEHQGSIEVASREGRGTTVMLNFPREKRHGERRDADSHAGDPHAARR